MNRPQETTRPESITTKRPGACHPEHDQTTPAGATLLTHDELTTGDMSAVQHPVWAPEPTADVQHCGAYGRFVVTHDISAYTHAGLFAHPGQATPVFVRFSSLCEAGPAGQLPDIRGFAVRFHTEEGDWDLVGQNTPVFFVRHPAKLAGLMRALQQGRQGDQAAAWDFWSRSPESLHPLTILMSDQGQAIDPRFMHGHGGHTYSFWNADRERFWVRFHFQPRLAPPPPTRAAGQSAPGQARPAFGDALRTAILQGERPAWTLSIQVMPEADAEHAAFDPFDPTQIWPQATHPLIQVGVMELDAHLDERFEQLERISLSAANLVPGIGHSRDPVLQARIFCCTDTIPNRWFDLEEDPVPGRAVSALRPPRSPAQGAHAADGEAGSDRHDSGPDDALRQAGALFRQLDPAHRQRLTQRFARAMQGAPATIIEQQLTHVERADGEYARRLREALESIRRPTVK